jgi:hypothetical protein
LHCVGLEIGQRIVWVSDLHANRTGNRMRNRTCRLGVDCRRPRSGRVAVASSSSSSFSFSSCLKIILMSWTCDRRELKCMCTLWSFGLDYFRVGKHWAVRQRDQWRLTLMSPLLQHKELFGLCAHGIYSLFSPIHF